MKTEQEIKKELIEIASGALSDILIENGIFLNYELKDEDAILRDIKPKLQEKYAEISSKVLGGDLENVFFKFSARINDIYGFTDAPLYKVGIQALYPDGKYQEYVVFNFSKDSILKSKNMEYLDNGLRFIFGKMHDAMCGTFANPELRDLLLKKDEKAIGYLYSSLNASIHHALGVMIAAKYIDEHFYK